MGLMTLTFGTAGLRAPVGPGDGQMNVKQVTRVTAGLASWFAERSAGLNRHHEAPSSLESGIGHALYGDEGPMQFVVGYDARYGSSIFARTAAEVLAGAGYDVILLPGPTPTPVVSWLIRERNLDGGIQITASQNPASDNGYKVYLEDGAQLPAELEASVLEEIAAVGSPSDVPRVTVRCTTDQQRRYVDQVVERVDPEEGDRLRVNNDRAALRVCYTAMHGVGGRALTQALQAAGFAQTWPVPEQQHPDPTFPTVRFPNPEEPDAVELVLATAQSVDADIIVALDPDADRCAVGCKDVDGTYRMLRGDELGPLLATRLVPACGTKAEGATARPIVATSIVSSRLLQRIAQDRGWDYRETPTGFKNLARAAGSPSDLAFAYEEAIGTCPYPGLVADKDGIATALIACCWAAELKSAGTTLLDELHALHRAYGYMAGTQVSLRSSDPAEIVSMIAAHAPHSVAGIPFTTTALPQAAGVLMTGESDVATIRVVARSSGTENKTKVYIEVSDTDTPATTDEILTAVADETREWMRTL